MRDTNRVLASAPETRPTAARPYYEALNQACDAIVRCNDCGRLVTHAALCGNKGTTPCCGTRRVKEVRTLSLWEWAKIRIGLLDFPYRKEFLREFSRGRA